MTESVFGAAPSWNGSVLQEIGTIAGNKATIPDGDGCEALLLREGFTLLGIFCRLAKDISS